MAFTLSNLRSEYQRLFDTCSITEKKFPEIDSCVDKIVANRAQYEAVSAQTGIPWYFIGIIHNMECSGKFNCHLHNGDPLTARTIQVPRNMPKNGTPPFTWQQSALDAMQHKKLHQWTDWSVPGMLFQLEKYNGFGYRPKHINSPYLWSFSNHYIKGKFVSDGSFNANATSKQIGAAVLLRRMSERGIAVAGELDVISLIKKLGPHVRFKPNVRDAKAEELQRLLNSIGLHLRIGGKAGENTSNAYKQISGTFLQGDPRG